MAADAVGNIYIALMVDTAGARNFTSAASSIDRDSQRIRTSLNNTSRSVTSLQSSMNQNLRVKLFSNMLKDASTAGSEVGKLRAAMLGLAAITGTSLTSAFAATFLLKTADAAKLMSNQLKTVTDSSEDLAAVQKKLYDVSQDTRSGMEATVTMYARLARAATNYGMTQDQLVRVTSTVQKAFAIGGATPEEAAGAALQLSQGIASNRFSGDEYRSVAENAPVLLQAMAKQLGVTIGQLRLMGQAGKLTGEVVARAILGASDEIDTSFAKTSVTVGQAMTRVGNAFLMYIGAGDKTYGVTGKLAGALSSLADNFDEIAKYLTLIAGLSAAAFGGKLLGGATTKAYSALIPNKAEVKAAQAELEGISKQRDAIAQAIAQTNSNLATSTPEGGVGPALPDAYTRKAIAAQQPAIASATNAQARAQEKLNSLEVERLIAEEKLETAQAKLIENLDKQVAKAQQLNAADAERVGLAMKAAAAEEAMTHLKVASNASVGTQSLEQSMAAEAEAMSRFDSSLGKLQTARQSLSQAAAGEFDTKAITAAAAQVNDLDRQITKAQADVAAAATNVDKAYVTSTESLKAADADRAAAITNISQLQEADTALRTKAIAVTDRLTLSQRALSVAQKAGGSVLAFLGGWTGVAFMAAIAGIGLYESNVEASIQKTADIRKEMEDLGLVSKDTADALNGVGKSIADMTQDELRSKLREINDEIAKMKNGQNAIDAVFHYDPQNLQNILNALNAITAPRMSPKGGNYFVADQASRDAAAQIADMVTQFEAGKKDAKDVNDLLDQISKQNLSGPMDDLIGRLRTAIPLLAGLLTYQQHVGAEVSGVAMIDQDTDKRNAVAFNKGQDITDAYTENLLRQANETAQQRQIETKAKSLQKSVPAGGNPLSDATAKALATTIVQKEAAESAALKSGTSDAKKFTEGMEKLNDEIAASPLDEFGQKVVETARTMGIGEKDIEAYAAAFASDDMTNAPKKLVEIADAMRKINAAKIQQNLAFDSSQLFASDADQKIASTLQGSGLSATDGQGLLIANEIRFNDTLQKTHDLAQGFLDGFLSDLENGVSLLDALNNACGKLAEQLLQMALDASINKLFQGLQGLGSGSGGLLGGILSVFGIGGSSAAGTGLGELGGYGSSYAVGGYTGDGGRFTPAGIVHKGEYVFNAAATARIGRARLDNLQGYADGGFVGAAANSNIDGGLRVEIYNEGGDPIAAKSASLSKDAKGINVAKIVVGAMKTAIADGTMDGTMSQVYGLKRQGR